MEEKYYHTKSSVEEYIKMAEGYNGARLISKLKEFLPANASLLELGSGPGTDYKILSEIYAVTGSDYSKAFLIHLKRSFPEGKFLELEAGLLRTEMRFEGIYSNKVLHHLSDEALQTSIKRQYDILNDGGIICHSFWKGEGDELFKGMYVNYHTEEDLEKAFTDHFEILTLEPYMEFEAGDSLLIIARKKNQYTPG